MTPKTMSEPSIITICPLRCDLDVSDCHVGTVLVFILPRRQQVHEPDLREVTDPLPNPVISLDAMSCPRLYEDA